MPYLTPQQARLHDDIRGLIQGEVRCDEITLQLYSTDAGILQCRPQAVVWPRDVNDVVACVQYAAKRAIPIHPRGSGTGMTGESLGSGIVLDFRRFMRRLVSLNRDSIVVQPGMIWRRLNSVLEKIQFRTFGSVSGFQPATTIGSILARNGAGSRWLQYGLPSDHVLELKVVLANGEILTLNREALPQAIEITQNKSFQKTVNSSNSSAENVARGIALARGIVLGKEHPVADEVYRVLAPFSRQINSAAAQQVAVNRAGYRCHGVLQGENGRHIDLASLLLGSEGTLGLIVEAKLQTIPCSKREAGAVFFFNGIEKAMLAVASILPFRPVLCELIDRRRFNMVREWDSRIRRFFPIEAEAILLIELDAGNTLDPPSTDEVQDRLTRLIKTVQEKEQLSFHSIRIRQPEHFEMFDDFLHRSELILFRMRRSNQPLPLFDDLAIPVPALRDFFLELLNVLKRHGITASISGHVGQGHLRIYPIVDLSNPEMSVLLQRLTEDVYALVWEHGGSISTEYGTGLLKSRFVLEQFPTLMPVFRNIKEIFDPDNLFNPGKVVPDASLWTDYLRRGLPHRGMEHPAKIASESNLREVSGIESGLFLFTEPVQQSESDSNVSETETPKNLSSQIELQLKWEPQHVFESVYLCNGCGECFRNDSISRMCPMSRNFTEETATPRAKANLLRGVLEGELDLETLTLEKAKEVADTCIHCGMCRIECPAEVDVSNLAFRCKSAYVAAHGLSLEDRFLSRIDSVLRFLAMVSCPVNWATSNPILRWLLEKILQIPQGRTLPKLAKVTFLARTQWSNWLTKHQPEEQSLESASDNRRVALFVDTFANHFDTKLADLAVRILQHNGFSVYVPPRQRPSGLTSFAAGHFDRAERLARHNSLLLADLIRQGYHVVALEPASASCLVLDYRNILDDIDAALVASHVVDFCDFLIQQHRNGHLRLDFVPNPKLAGKTIGYHAPCRSVVRTTRRTNVPTPAEELLRLIPELNVHRIEQGCCGMAGSFGFKQKNYRRSLRIGVALFKELRQSEIDFGVSDCISCCIQMEHGARKKTFHPIRLLAAAYGLASEVTEML